MFLATGEGGKATGCKDHTYKAKVCPQCLGTSLPVSRTVVPRHRGQTLALRKPPEDESNAPNPAKTRTPRKRSTNTAKEAPSPAPPGGTRMELPVLELLLRCRCFENLPAGKARDRARRRHAAQQDKATCLEGLALSPVPPPPPQENTARKPTKQGRGTGERANPRGHEVLNKSRDGALGARSSYSTRR